MAAPMDIDYRRGCGCDLASVQFLGLVVRQLAL
jgi:hypothetical protein